MVALQGRVGILKVHARQKKVDPNLGERARLLVRAREEAKFVCVVVALTPPPN